MARLRNRESLRRRGCDSINVLRQVGVGHGGDRTLAEIIVIQPKDAGIGSKAEFVCAVAPGEVIVDKKPRGAPSLDPGIVEAAERGERRIRAAALQNDRETRKESSENPSGPNRLSYQENAGLK